MATTVVKMMLSHRKFPLKVNDIEKKKRRLLNLFSRLKAETYQSKYQEDIMDTSCDDREEEEIDNRRAMYAQVEHTPSKSVNAFTVVSEPFKKRLTPMRNNPCPRDSSKVYGDIGYAKQPEVKLFTVRQVFCMSRCHTILINPSFLPACLPCSPVCLSV